MKLLKLKKPREGALHDWIVKLSERSYRVIVLIYLGSVVVFAILYFALGWVLPGESPIPDVKTSPVYGFLNSLFFSTITATSVGYGEFEPHGFSKVIASLQSFLSLLLAAIFVTKPISTKQEQALFTMHRLAFDNTFASLREGMYIVRRDFETVLSEAEKNGTIGESSWSRLATTYRHMQVLIEDIGRMLSPESGLYTIDKHREILLLEAMERTLERMDTMFEAFDARNIPWRSQKTSTDRIVKLLTAAKKTVERWKRKSPNREPENFLEIEKMIGELEKDAKNADLQK